MTRGKLFPARGARAVALWLGASTLWAGPSAGAAELTILGPPEPVVAWSKCDERDVADGGLRAYRDASNNVVAIASETATRLMRGPSLDELSRSCAVSMNSRFSSKPEDHLDQTWLLATWTDDGKTVMGIGHDEYHAETHPGRCNGTTPRECRYGTLVFLRSPDGGRHFEHTDARPLAAPPVRQAPDLGKDTGFFQPSNIFAFDGVKYVFVRTSGGGAQPPATCLLRSPKPIDAESWQIYVKSGFIKQRFDPYRDDIEAYKPCQQIAPLNGMVWSVVTHEPSGKLVAVLTVIDPKTRKSRLAISVGTDPLTWSKPQMIDAPFFGIEPACGKAYSYWYPSLIDPASRARNFDTVGNEPMLYFARLANKDCHLTMQRDLAVAPVRLSIE